VADSICPLCTVRDLWQKQEYVDVSDLLNDVIIDEDNVDATLLSEEEVEKHKERLRFYYNTQALALNKLGKFEHSIKISDAYISKHTAGDPEPYAVKAQSHFGLRQYSKAIECLNKLLQLCPNEPETVVNKSMCLFQLERYDECLQWIEIGHRLIEQRLQMGNLNQDDPFGEQVLLSSVVVVGQQQQQQQQQPQDSMTTRMKMWGAELNSIKSAALCKQQSWEAAIKAANLTLDFNPRHLKALESKTIALLETNKPQEALASAQAIIDQEPENIPALHFKARSLARSQRLAEAVVAFDTVIDLSLKRSTDATPYDIVTPTLQKSALLSLLSRNEDALKVAEDALRYNSKDSNIYAQMGYCLTRLHRYEEAKKAYEQSIKCDAKFKEGHINIGVILEKLGRHGEAIEEYQKALQLDPKHLMALTNLARIHLDYFKEYAEAVEVANRMLKVDNKSVEAFMIQAKAYQHLGMRQHAMTAAQRAFEIRPELLKAAQEEAVKKGYKIE